MNNVIENNKTDCTIIDDIDNVINIKNWIALCGMKQKVELNWIELNASHHSRPFGIKRALNTELGTFGIF